MNEEALNSGYCFYPSIHQPYISQSILPFIFNKHCVCVCVFVVSKRFNMYYVIIIILFIKTFEDNNDNNQQYSSLPAQPDRYTWMWLTWLDLTPSFIILSIYVLLFFFPGENIAIKSSSSLSTTFDNNNNNNYNLASSFPFQTFSKTHTHTHTITTQFPAATNPQQ